MKKIVLGTLLSLILSLNVFAQQITVSPANEQNNGVQLSTSLSDGTTTMPLAAAAMGTKKIGLVFYRVAVNQFFAEHPENLVRSDAGIYPSLFNAGKLAFRVTLLRGVDAALIQSSIDTAIADNISAQDLPKFQADIDQVTAAMSKEQSINFGASISFVAYPATNQVLYENSHGVDTLMQFQAPGFVYKIFAIWYGNQSAVEGQRLKALLLTAPSVTPKQ